VNARAAMMNADRVDRFRLAATFLAATFHAEFSKPAQPVVRIFCNSLITAVADHRRLS
jgi:hypothetical protein